VGKPTYSKNKKAGHRGTPWGTPGQIVYTIHIQSAQEGHMANVIKIYDKTLDKYKKRAIL